MRVDYDKDQLAYALANALKERDEAREDLEHVKEYGTEEINAAVELRQKLAQALVERDEARNDIIGWENKWRCAVDMAARAELERDEALKCAKEYYVKFIRNASSDNKVSKPNPLNPFYKY
jgi:hypothetical protein